jgi:RHS repeat-associated protein
VTTFYLVDVLNPSGYAQVLEELTSGVGTNFYTYGLDLISQRRAGVSTNFFGYDGHGSTRFLVNSDGTVVNAFTYDAYGTLIASNATAQTAYLYCGEQFDNDLGFYYLRARYLNPNTGRFWTMDSYAGNNSDPLSLHKYIYCHGNPVALIDPSGYFTSTAEVGTSTTIATRLETLAISAVATVYVTYAIYSGAKGISDNNQFKQLAQNLGVEVEPAVYLSDLQNDTDWGRESRKRESGWEYFAHGTSTGAWKGSSILASGGGDFGTGFYTFKANLRGLFWAGGRATKAANGPQGGGLPFIVVAKIKRDDLNGMMSTALDLRSDSAQWTTTVTGYLNNGGQGSSGHPIVIGPISVQGRRLNEGETPTQRADMPSQWKWEDVSKLKPAAIIPVFNGFNQKLAW